jgi:hypothetical protein
MRGSSMPGGLRCGNRPKGHSIEPFSVDFGRPLDHGLLGRCLDVIGPDRRRVNGVPEVGPEERSWRLVPARTWAPGPHWLVVNPILEDMSGNSVIRVFDRDLSRPEDEPREARAVRIPFLPLQ